jgi:hypothetical protein
MVKNVKEKRFCFDLLEVVATLSKKKEVVATIRSFRKK